MSVKDFDWEQAGYDIEEKLISSGRLAGYFEGAENLFPTLRLSYSPSEKLMKVEIVVETDGSPIVDDPEEEINDYIMDNYLTEILNQAGISEDADFDISVSIKPYIEDKCDDVDL
ncbi:MAG: hypothetical protein IPK63_19850 [Candidatus Competibacteraceae bacterium]|nr:hypothetical protein [Candidatus Competibacteraceae bacterium]